ncbi:hypothetical protein G9403_02435 [Weissella paramesenteroides]|uniref:DUF1642 domain-containing protein n=1 Tax=Weissella paramesenteroides TaxID=1249 RepID=A0ABD4XH71_WEIPA|nr:hypothetical protein [Weissella paramesenteroides]MDF8368290.1 hypothetical protein [Weissella paramesenteroides]MDF8370521.1 hypothetical protein [Weissella paramesenteroides]
MQMIMKDVKTMTSKAYIVANEQQEMAVLRELDKNGNEWNDKRNATDFIPSEKSYVKFPYAIMSDRFIGWLSIDDAIVENYEIVYDGRKEEQMSDKYVVSQEFMDGLEEWKDYCFEEYGVAINSGSIEDLPIVVNAWWGDEVPDEENNNRLIAIIRWVNGEDVFEVEKPKKWVVRSIGLTDDDERYYVSIGKFMGLKRALNTYIINQATRFDTKEEAQSWANSHQEVFDVVDV